MNALLWSFSDCPSQGPYWTRIRGTPGSVINVPGTRIISLIKYQSSDPRVSQVQLVRIHHSRHGAIYARVHCQRFHPSVPTPTHSLYLVSRERKRESFTERSKPPMAATKVYIVYYSMYGHVEKLAEEIKKGAASVEGVEAKLWQVPETLPEEVLGKMGAPPKSDVPIITPNELPEADGLLFGFPTRFGLMAAQFKAFMDATGGLWRTQALAGKPAGIFYSTGSQGGGQETTPLTSITQLAHHGLIFVPIGYTFGAGMFEMEEVKGGSPYGAGTYAGDGSRQPTELELAQAFHQGKYFAAIAKKLKGSQ